MAPLPLHLPTIEQLLPHLPPNWVLAKRDWRHGFHHLTIHPDHRKYLGLRLADKRIARMKALAFGPSQGPAIFNSVSTEFARLAYLHLATLGYT